MTTIKEAVFSNYVATSSDCSRLSAVLKKFVDSSLTNPQSKMFRSIATNNGSNTYQAADIGINPIELELLSKCGPHVGSDIETLTNSKHGIKTSAVLMRGSESASGEAIFRIGLRSF